jgi:hypothetical protein
MAAARLYCSSVLDANLRTTHARNRRRAQPRSPGYPADPLAKHMVSSPTSLPAAGRPAGRSYTAEPLPAQTESADVATGEAQRFVRDLDIPGQWWTL